MLPTKHDQYPPRVQVGRELAEVQHWLTAQVNAAHRSPEDKKAARHAAEELTRPREDHPPRNNKPAFIPADKRDKYQGVPTAEDQQPNAEERLIEAELGNLVWQVLAEFPEADRRLLLAYVQGGKTQQELATQLGISQGRVSQKLKRLHQRFAAVLGQRMSLDRMLRMAPTGYRALLQALPELVLSEAVLALVGEIGLRFAEGLEGEEEPAAVPDEAQTNTSVRAVFQAETAYEAFSRLLSARLAGQKRRSVVAWFGIRPGELCRLLMVDGIKNRLHKQRLQAPMLGLEL